MIEVGRMKASSSVCASAVGGLAAAALLSWFVMRRRRNKMRKHALAASLAKALASDANKAWVQPLDSTRLRELEQLATAWLLRPPPRRPPTTTAASRLQCRVHLLLAHQAPRRATDEAHDERLLCKICLTNELDTCLVPCGHLVCCLSCFSNLSELKCPVCCAPVRDLAQTYFT